MQFLSKHLQDCGFDLTARRARRNLQILAELDIYITDGDTSAASTWIPFITWRKTASLLRHVREWNAERAAGAQPGRHEDPADEIEKAHGRKTRLAMDIVRMLESLREGGNSAVALSAVTDILAKASHGNRSGVAELEAKAQAELESPSGGVSDRPLRLSSSELQEHLKKIEGYFHIEYRLLLERVSKLAAKSIILGGRCCWRALGRVEGRRLPGPRHHPAPSAPTASCGCSSPSPSAAS